MNSIFSYGLCTLVLFFSGHLFASTGDDQNIYYAQYEDLGPQGKTLIKRGVHKGSIAGAELEETSRPLTIVEGELPTGGVLKEIRSIDRSVIDGVLKQRGVAPRPSSNDFINDELYTIIESGPSSNRIDLVFMGDGYTLGERAKFLEDVERLTADLFEEKTFRSSLPLFNVYAVYRPSKDSGITRSGKRRETAYGLYRIGNTLRAIYVDKPGAARDSCDRAPGCDFPIIVANDDYYGGLGGEFAITTRSHNTGTMVLRHELGHNFGSVGEEYDGGGYFGKNFSKNLKSLSWKPWLSAQELRAEPAVARKIDWPWKPVADNLRYTFKSDGKFPKCSIRLGLAGNKDGAVQMHLNGVPLDIRQPDHDDRYFQDVMCQAVAQGQNTLVLKTENPKHKALLTNLSIHEYGEDFRSEEGFVGAFPLFGKNNRVLGYRPTAETCLMRNMRSDVFCSVCQENNWLNFFKRVSLIDEVKVSSNDDRVRVQLKTPQILQRHSPNENNALGIKWFLAGVEQTDLENQLSWIADPLEAKGRWLVEVTFHSEELSVAQVFNRRFTL